MTRSKYIIWFIAFVFALFVLNIFARAVENSLDNTVMSSINALRILIVALFGYLCVAKRLKAIGKNPYLAWLIAIPLFGFIFCVYLCLKKSEETKIKVE